jgi:hypothetical protein
MNAFLLDEAGCRRVLVEDEQVMIATIFSKLWPVAGKLAKAR